MKVKLEIADTPKTLAYGLMHRKEMPKDHGMLFKFPSPVEASFWGKNTYIPLDVAFIYDNKIVDIKNIVPMSTKSIRSEYPCSSAIEVNAGFFAEHGITKGSTVNITQTDGNSEAEFKSC